MFNINAAEFLTIAVIALIVVGPRRLPEIARRLGSFVARVSETSEIVRREIREGLEGSSRPPGREDE